MIKLKEKFPSGLLIHYRGLSHNFRGVIVKDIWYESIINPKGYVINIVNSDNKVVCKFYIEEYEQEYNEILYEGREFRLWIKADCILAMTEEEFQDEIKKQEAEHIVEENKTKAIRESEYQAQLKIKKECEIFYENLYIPVRTTPVYMIVASGLTVNSAGNGANKSTVTHLRVDEYLDDGKRFKREIGSLICNQKRKGKKTFWLEESINATLKGERYYNKVTCKSCLKILRSKGWMKESD